MTSLRWIAFLLLSLSLVGCGETDQEIANGDDPLKALEVPLRSDRYVSTYWTRKKIDDPELWAQAAAYCEDKNDGEHPNCDAVRYVQMIDRMSRPPEDRPNDFRLMMPQPAEPNDVPKVP